MQQTLASFIKEHDVIGVKQYHEDDFCVFIQTEQEHNDNQLNAQANQIRKEIEERVKLALNTYIDGHILLQMGQGYYFAKPKQCVLDYAPNHFDLIKQKTVLRHQIDQMLANQLLV